MLSAVCCLHTLAGILLHCHFPVTGQCTHNLMCTRNRTYCIVAKDVEPHTVDTQNYFVQLSCLICIGFLHLLCCGAQSLVGSVGQLSVSAFIRHAAATWHCDADAQGASQPDMITKTSTITNLLSPFHTLTPAHSSDYLVPASLATHFIILVLAGRKM